MKSNFEKVQEFNNCGGNTFGRYSGDPQGEGPSTQISLIEEELEELWAASNREEIRDAIADVLVTTYGLAHILGISADADMDIVHKSNMSKFCRLRAGAEKTVEKYKEIGIDAIIEEIEDSEGGKLFVLKSKEDQKDHSDKFYPKGKILKGINYKRPNWDK